MLNKVPVPIISGKSRLAGKKIIIASSSISVLALLLLLLYNFTSTNQLVADKNEVRIKTEVVKNDHQKSEDEHSCCEDEEDTEAYSDNSIYQLESDLPAGKAGWTNQYGKKFALGELKGKQVVLIMFFANCTYACPILVNDMKRIEASIPREKLSSYKFVLVSIDPERDTPESLNEFGKRNNLDIKRWRLLSGTKDDVMELAALIGFKYKKDDKGDFSHSNLITFLNEKGEIVHQQVGLNLPTGRQARM